MEGLFEVEKDLPKIWVGIHHPILSESEGEWEQLIRLDKIVYILTSWNTGLGRWVLKVMIEAQSGIHPITLKLIPEDYNIFMGKLTKYWEGKK